MPLLSSQLTASLRRKPRTPQNHGHETLSPTLEIPSSFGFSVYDNAIFRELPGGGVNFEAKSPVARGTARTIGRCLDTGIPVVKYEWKEASQQPDGSVEKLNPKKWSNDEDSVFLKQTDTGGRYRLVSIWNTRDSAVRGTKIAGQVAVSNWFGPEKSTPTSHNVASAIVTATAGMVFMGLGSSTNPLTREVGFWVSQGNLPSDTERGETDTHQWEVLEETQSRRLTHNHQGTIESELPNQNQGDSVPPYFQTDSPSQPQGTDTGCNSGQRQQHGTSVPYFLLGAAMC